MERKIKIHDNGCGFTTPLETMTNEQLITIAYKLRSELDSSNKMVNDLSDAISFPELTVPKLKDEYLIEGASYERLLKEYRQYGSLVIAYDFDSTVFDFHGKGATYNQVIHLLRRLQNIGCYLICFTANEDLLHVRKHLNEKYIPYDGINCNPPFFKSKAKKIYYNALLDDRSGLLQTYTELLRLVDEVAFDFLKQ